MFDFIKSIRSHLSKRFVDDTYLFSTMDIPPEGFFTQSELDQLKCVISESIQIEEMLRNKEKENAEIALEKDTKAYWYKQMRKSNKRIQLLANLQQKIKYSLITMG